MEIDPRIFQDRGLPPSDGLRRYTAAPWLPLDAPSVSAGTRDCVRKMSGPICVAEPASPPAESIDPAPSGCQAFAPRRPASGFLLALPVVVGRSHATAVPVSWASVASGSPRALRLSCRRFPDFLCSSSLAYTPASSFPARRLLPSTVRDSLDVRFRISPCAIRSLPEKPSELHSSPPQ